MRDGGEETGGPAQAEWPADWVPQDQFAAYVAERPQVAPDHLADLYLACACARGLPAALAAFEQRHAPEVVRALQRLRLSADQVTEVTQLVRQDLLLAPPGAAAAIATYSGRGPLGAWVRVSATRRGLRALRRSGGTEGGDESEILAARSPSDDPELAYIKSLYGDAFRAAFLAAVESLEDRDKNVLRQHFIDGLTIDDLAALYRVHRATAARWVTLARTRLLDATRREFARQADVGTLECESVLRLLHSRLDVTWQRLLA